MLSSVYGIHRSTLVSAVLGVWIVVAATLVASPLEAQAGAEPESRLNPFADRFPNVVLKTHEGRNVRFYDDLLKDKIVMINFMYATCTER